MSFCTAYVDVSISTRFPQSYCSRTLVPNRALSTTHIWQNKRLIPNAGGFARGGERGGMSPHGGSWLGRCIHGGGSDPGNRKMVLAKRHLSVQMVQRLPARAGTTAKQSDWSLQRSVRRRIILDPTVNLCSLPQAHIAHRFGSNTPQPCQIGLTRPSKEALSTGRDTLC